jgi:hypothetical protein
LVYDHGTVKFRGDALDFFLDVVRNCSSGEHRFYDHMCALFVRFDRLRKDDEAVLTVVLIDMNSDGDFYMYDEGDLETVREALQEEISRVNERLRFLEGHLFWYRPNETLNCGFRWNGLHDKDKEETFEEFKIQMNVLLSIFAASFISNGTLNLKHFFS